MQSPRDRDFLFLAGTRQMAQIVRMRHRVVGELVPGADHPPEHLRRQLLQPDVVAHHEEGRLHAELGKQIQETIDDPLVVPVAIRMIEAQRLGIVVDALEVDRDVGDALVQGMR